MVAGHPVPLVTEIVQDAFLTDGQQLYEVLEVKGDQVLVANSWTHHSDQFDMDDLLRPPWWVALTAHARARNAELT